MVRAEIISNKTKEMSPELSASQRFDLLGVNETVSLSGAGLKPRVTKDD